MKDFSKFLNFMHHVLQKEEILRNAGFIISYGNGHSITFSFDGVQVASINNSNGDSVHVIFDMNHFLIVMKVLSDVIELAVK